MNTSIDEIKSKLDVAEVLKDYLELKKAGTNYKAVCPFHNEKTPSLMVSPSKQIWHCFGCGVGGDIFEFIKLSENVEFGDALKILADRAGVEFKKLTPEQVQQGKRKNDLYEINATAAKYFQKVLWESPSAKEALDYLKNRGLTDQTIKNWQLGFAPDDFHYLENFLSKTYDKKDIVTAGLIIKKDSDGSYFDRFRDRIMFPIHNLHGQVVGFTARLLHDKPNTGKYINSPETPIYNKSRELYGLYQAKNKIRKDNRIVLVEGNMDVIASHQAGVETAIASSGTALTEPQLRILQRFAEKLIFAFDGDVAGLAAARRALDTALSLDFNLKLVDLQGAKDPDELIKRGVGLWQKAIERAQDYVDFFFDKTLDQVDPTSVEGKREATKALVPLIYQISDPITKAHYIRKLSNSLNVAESAVWDIINRLSVPRPKTKEKQSSGRKSKREILEDQILGLTLIFERPQYLVNFEASEFTDQNKKLFDILKNTDQIQPEILQQKHTDLSDRIEILVFASKTTLNEQKLNLQQELIRVTAELKKIILKEKMEKISFALKSAEKEKNRELAEKLSLEFTDLSTQINQYNK